jgi:hypothetical protein
MGAQRGMLARGSAPLGVGARFKFELPVFECLNLEFCNWNFKIRR